MEVRLKDKYRPPWKLRHGAVYRVIGIEADYYRIIDEDGSPALYDPELFEIIEPSQPEDWVTSFGADGERYAYPPELDKPGLFEDYHDGDETAIAIVREYIARDN